MPLVKVRFRVWIPLVAVLIVLLSIATLLLYILPAVDSRLGEYVEDRALTRAAAAASAAAVSEGRDLRVELEVAAEAGGGEVLVVDRRGAVVERAGPVLLSPPPEEVLRSAADGKRSNELLAEQRVAVVPLVQGGRLQGGVVFAPDEGESVLYDLFLRSGVEAAAIASIIGGGLALLLATLLGRRVERIAFGARAMGRGNLRTRIEPGFDDELGELARAFNGMAGQLGDSFSRLKESDATLNTILNNLVEGVLATDLKGEIVFANPSARAMLGLEGEGPPGRVPSPWKDFDLREAVDRCLTAQECPEALLSQGEDFLQVRLEHMPRFDDNRGGVLVVIRDLSEGRRLEANQQRFLANAAHELKTPITTVLGAAELLLTEEEDDPEARQRFLNHIYDEARRMQRLSETLLKMARTGYNLREANVGVVDLDSAARSVVERLKPLAESAGLTLSVEGSGGRVWADYEWLEQALLVVVSNATQHSERGSAVRVRVSDNTVAVEDEGSGISEADLPRVFERFYKGKQDGRQASVTGGGFGLGLAICKELVEGMGGEISVSSEEEVGTTVEISLRKLDARA